MGGRGREEVKEEGRERKGREGGGKGKGDRGNGRDGRGHGMGGEGRKRERRRKGRRGATALNFNSWRHHWLQSRMFKMSLHWNTWSGARDSRQQQQ